LGKNRTSLQISNSLLEQLGSSSKKLEEKLLKALKDCDAEDLGGIRIRIELYLEKELDRELNKLKEKTGRPKWNVVENLLRKALEQDAEIQIEPEPELEEEEIHIEPDSCPDCGSSDIMVSNANYTYYCYDCMEEGEW